MIQVNLLAQNGHGAKEVGRLVFRSLLVLSDNDYHCVPEGLLTFNQVQEVCKELRHLPQIHSGKVGPFTWQEITAAEANWSPGTAHSR